MESSKERLASADRAQTLAIGAGLALLGALSLVTAAQLWARPSAMPAWFPAGFFVGVVGLVGYSALVLWSMWRGTDAREQLSTRTGGAMLVLVGLVGLCVSSVHQFSVFEARYYQAWSNLPMVLRLNLVLTILSMLVPIALVWSYRAGHRRRTRWLIIGLAFMVLVPNDDCPNDFNNGWLETTGWSPMMFVPVAYALLFVAAAMRGASLGLVAVGLIGIGLASLGLGFGHITGFLW